MKHALNRLPLVLAFFLTLACLACSEKETPPPVKPEKKVEKKVEAPKAPEKKEAPKEIIFDPRNPPAGYVNCHRNHCHKVGGGIASYKKVMEEIGATKIIGVPKKAPMPPAPADVAAPPSDAVKTASGLATKVLKPGDGKKKPGPNSIVQIHYTGWTADGKGFDSSISRGKPTTIPVDKVFPGWSEALQMMSVGEERRLWVPEKLAFNGRSGKPAGMLVFEIELLDVKDAPAPK
jgi:hypothetical protein